MNARRCGFTVTPFLFLTEIILQMYYKINGKGRVVVLLHGFIEEGSMWNETVKVLSKKYKNNCSGP